MQANIISIPLSKLTKLDVDMNEQMLSELIKAVPQAGKENPTNFILNNHLTIFNNGKPELIKKLNVLLQLTRTKYNLIQILKNQ